MNKNTYKVVSMPDNLQCSKYIFWYVSLAVQYLFPVDSFQLPYVLFDFFSGQYQLLLITLDIDGVFLPSLILTQILYSAYKYVKTNLNVKIYL